MPANQNRIDNLVINSAPVAFKAATLKRGQAELPSGAPGSTEWSVEIVDGALPGGDDHVLVELTTDGGNYSGAASIVGAERQERVTLVGNGPLLGGQAGPELH